MDIARSPIQSRNVERLTPGNNLWSLNYLKYSIREQHFIRHLLLTLNLFFHTRCKEMRFCNKQCEKEAHTKEKSTEMVPENPGQTEDLLKKEMEAEMKRGEKRKKINIRRSKCPAHIRWLTK